MSITRIKNSTITNGTPKYDRMLAGLPYIPIIGTATDGGTGSTVSVGFTGNNIANGTITYTALSTPGSLTATGTSSPITVTGLTAGTAYTFQVSAANSQGSSAYSAASNSVTPVTPSSFESIATATPTSGTTVTFSSIPSTYSHLQIRVNIIDNSNPTLLVRLNGATSYANHALRADGGTVSATGNTAQTYIYGASTWTQPSTLKPLVGIVDIHDYASTSKNKTVRILSGQNNNAGATAEEIKLSSGLWVSTSAVNSVSISTSGAYATGTTIALYGIKG